MNNLAPSRNGRRVGTVPSWDPMRLLDDLMTWEPPGAEVVWSAFPSPVNIVHAEDGAKITADLPGVEPDDLDLTYDRGTLAIAGKRGDQTYRYNVALGDTFDPDTIEARLANGVLVVHVRKRPEATPRKISLTSTKALDPGESK